MVAIAYDSTYELLPVDGRRWSHRVYKIRMTVGSAFLERGTQTCTNGSPNPPKSEAPTLTRQWGTLGQRNTPSFLIKLLFKNVCPSQRLVNHSLFTAPPTPVLVLMRSSSNTTDGRCCAFVSTSRY